MWESRALCEISKRLWKSFWDFHRRVMSTAPSSFTSADPAAVPCRRKAARLAIDVAQFHLHEMDTPIAPLGFREPDQFTTHRFTQRSVSRAS